MGLKMNKRMFFVIVIIMMILAVAGIMMMSSKILGNADSGKSRTVPEVLQRLPLSQIRQSDKVMIARLDNAIPIDGFSCASGWVHFTAEGRLQAFYLAETSDIQGNPIPKGTWIRLHPDQTLQFCCFPEDTTIQGYLCDGGRGGSEGVTTSFYPSGKLKSFYSPKDAVIHEIPCQAGLFQMISLYENGNLKQFTLSQNVVISGRNLFAGQTVIMDEGGQVQSVESPSILQRTRNWIVRIF
jgi:hypothetical protein